MQMVDPFVIGAGAAALAIIMTLFMPVSRHRVNQGLITLIIVVLVFVAAFALFDIPLAFWAGTGGTAIALIFRDVRRWVQEFMWHNVFRYTHRYYWYNRVGRAILGSGRGRRRSRD